MRWNPDGYNKKRKAFSLLGFIHIYHRDGPIGFRLGYYPRWIGFGPTWNIGRDRSGNKKP